MLECVTDEVAGQGLMEWRIRYRNEQFAHRLRFLCSLLGAEPAHVAHETGELGANSHCVRMC